MKVLVVGGAGYIGSHMVQCLLHEGHEPVTLDNLSTGYRDAVIGGEFIEGDAGDSNLLARIFSESSFDGVMHFASFIEVGESVTDPGKYYQNNLARTLNLLDGMVAHDVKRFIFSSSAAIFGEPQAKLIDEAHPKSPINPYGWTKLMVEQILSDYEKAHGLKSVSLRYFNAAGADPAGKLGERHEPESHLIPLVLRVASGRQEAIKVFGRDYDTPDGTCIRDFIHVLDLCQAHLLALSMLYNGGGSMALNLGSSQGFSVQEVIDTAQEVTGRTINVIDAPRRAGDPARLVAETSRAKTILGWNPRYSELKEILKHAWAWERNLAEGIAR
ncbi:MAG: UDP-glucose 4-epimerase GalE [candidate division Zixibacteria bacterium]|nr:UDP-glucose 4-epimerase GalE [candidate division Zixibacteria bacterium]